MKLLLLTALAAVAMAEPEAEPGWTPGVHPYAYGAYPYYGYGRYYGFPGVAGHPTGTSYTHRSPQGIGKRSAEEPAKGVHPGGATSYVGQTVWGFPRSKRSAEADAEPGYYHPYAYGAYPYAYGAYPYGYGYLRGAAVSYTHRSPQGIGKRSADAEPEAEPYYPYAYGAYAYGYPYGYGHQLNWPSYRAPGVSSTVWGLRG